MTSTVNTSDEHPRLSRRRFLSGCALAGGLAMTSPLLAALAAAESRTLAFHHTHTGERARITYWRDGEYQSEALRSLDRLLRDHRTGESIPIDRALLDMLHHLQLILGLETEFGIISAYRSPRTNAMLRKKSAGVAKRSLHMQGRAIDIRLPGCDLRTLRDGAIAMRAGGVGYYPKSDFIHVDTGPFRYW